MVEHQSDPSSVDDLYGHFRWRCHRLLNSSPAGTRSSIHDLPALPPAIEFVRNADRRVALAYYRRVALTVDCRIAAVYANSVIKSFRHKGLEQFFRTGSKARIQPKHAEKLRLQLFALNNAQRPTDMNAPGWRLHRLTGDLADHWSIDVSGNWRLTFTFQGQDAILVDYQDYH